MPNLDVIRVVLIIVRVLMAVAMVVAVVVWLVPLVTMGTSLLPAAVTELTNRFDGTVQGFQMYTVPTDMMEALTPGLSGALMGLVVMLPGVWLAWVLYRFASRALS